MVVIGMIIIFLGVHSDDRILGNECLQIVDVSQGLLKLRLQLLFLFDEVADRGRLCIECLEINFLLGLE